MLVAEKTVKADTKLWQDFVEKGSTETRNSLVERYHHLVRYIAERMKSKLPKTVQIEDLMSAGIFGLLDAIAKYDLSREVKFETYCSTRIRGAMLDELRKQDWVPRLVRSNAHQIEHASRELRKTLGRLPSDEELAEKMGMSAEEFGELASSAVAAAMVPFSTRFSDDDEGRQDHVGDIMEDESNENPYARLQREELKDIIAKELTEREKQIILLYYFDELTLKEIGAVQGLSESRVCQIHSKVLMRLKGTLAPRRDDIWPE